MMCHVFAAWKNKYFFQWMSDILSFLFFFIKYMITKSQILKQCTSWKVFYYQRAHLDYLNFIYSTKMQKKSLLFLNVTIHASTVPSLTIAIARFLARASLRSSTLVSSMSSSWKDRCARIRRAVDCMSATLRNTLCCTRVWACVLQAKHCIRDKLRLQELHRKLKASFLNKQWTASPEQH